MKTLIFSLRDQFVDAARKRDFTAPELAQLKSICDKNALHLDALYPNKHSGPLASDFYVAGDSVHKAAVISALATCPAVKDVSSPPPRTLIS